MTDLFPSRWPVAHPDRIQLYAFGTPNGRKITIALEEMELPYELHVVNIMKGEQSDPEYLRVNPNAKIPSIVDPDGPGGEPIAIMESGAILQYLGEKSGKLLPSDPAGRWAAIQWVNFQVASVGPMLGQFGHFFKFAKGKTDGYGEERYRNETKRLLGVLDRQLEGRDFLIGDYSIADVATFPWIKGLAWYEALDAVDYASFTNVEPWVERCLARPKTAVGYDATDKT